MFDPTIFENLKVGIENVVYDLDNQAGIINVTGRTDRLDMAVMSRSFGLTFELAGQKGVSAEIWLEAGLHDLAAEILETQDQQPGCELKLRFYKDIADVSRECQHISQIIEKIWEPELPTVQTIRYIYGREPILYHNTIEVGFPRKINEDQMEDLPKLVNYMLRTLEELNRMM
ncbi:hypothetical protein [Paenibacillus caui]|uniref:hypothetical protein n=1 Tax=Paenibacillus caui TaxID=2873927 RepID=UPI001CA7CEB9|nr:hypothetical protein [Paenibacillus caui]